MPTTPVQGLPYPALSDPANGPVAFQNLATALEDYKTLVRCTSSTRPGHVEGRVIYETDTDKLLVSNGTAWVDFASRWTPRGVLHSMSLAAPSAGMGDVSWGTSPQAGIPVAGRRVRLTATGGMNPASVGTGMLLQFMRAVNGGAGVQVGPRFYHVAPNAFEEGFTFTMHDEGPATGTVVYYVRCQGHYTSGATLTIGTQFIVEDAGSIA
jgi:hypothetical protein